MLRKTTAGGVMLTELARERGVAVPLVPRAAATAAAVWTRLGGTPSSAVVIAKTPPSSLSVTDSMSEPDEPVVDVDGRRASVAGTASGTMLRATSACRLAPRIFLYLASSLSASLCDMNVPSRRSQFVCPRFTPLVIGIMQKRSTRSATHEERLRVILSLAE